MSLNSRPFKTIFIVKCGGGSAFLKLRQAFNMSYAG